MNTLNNQCFLKKEANGITAEQNLLELLSQFFDAQLVGSVALGLIVKLDIDLHPFVITNDLLFVTGQVYHELLNNNKIREIRISDYRQSSSYQ